MVKKNFSLINAMKNLVRPWAIPGTPGLEHRIGGSGKRKYYR